jgi:hypothetical protein
LASDPDKVSINVCDEIPAEVALTMVRPRVFDRVSLTVADPVTSVVSVVADRVEPLSGFSVNSNSTGVLVTA